MSCLPIHALLVLVRFAMFTLCCLMFLHCLFLPAAAPVSNSSLIVFENCLYFRCALCVLVCPRFCSPQDYQLFALFVLRHHLAHPAQLHVRGHKLSTQPSVSRRCPLFHIVVILALASALNLHRRCIVSSAAANPFLVRYTRRPSSPGVGAAYLARDATLRLKYRLYFIHPIPSHHAYTPCTFSPHTCTPSNLCSRFVSRCFRSS